MTERTAIVAKPIDRNGELYQRRALETLPILVRQAWAGRPIYYGDIARELGMANPRNMNYVLGSVGRSLELLAADWNVQIPPLQVLVVNVGSDLPGEGFTEFIDDPEAFKKAPLFQRKRTIESLAARVRAYPRWRDVLQALGASLPPAPDLDALIPVGERHRLVGQGESPAHLELKLFISRNPDLVEVKDIVREAEIEYSFPSSDTADVLFTTKTTLVAVEVKSALSSEMDLLRGIFQCVKYRALLDAVIAVEQRELIATALLAIEGTLPESLRTIASTLGVSVFDNVREPRDAV